MAEKKEKPNKQGKRTISFVLLAVIIILGAVGLYLYMRYKATHISTDDAFVDGRVHVIASKIPGTVRALHITDNKLVKKNDPLLVGGMGGRMVAVPFNELSKSGGNVFTLHTTKEKLLNSPAFAWTQMNDMRYAENIYGYYGVQPYWEEK